MIVKRIKKLKDLKELWVDMQQNNSHMNPFQYYEYYEEISKHAFLYRLKERSAPQLYIITSDEGIPIMIAPLCRVFGKKNEYHILGNGQAASLDFIYKDSITSNEIDECIKAIKRTLGGTIILTRVRPDSPLLSSPELGESHSPIKFVTLHFPEGYDGFWVKLSKSTKQNIRTAYNHLKTDECQFQFVKKKYGELTDEEQRELSNLYIRRISQRYNKPNNFIFRYLYDNVHHYSVVFKKLANVDYYIVKINGKIASFLAGMSNISGTYFVVPRLAIDEKYGRYSPGMILVNEVVKEMSINSNIRELDLSRGDEKYKYVLGGEEYQPSDYIIR